MTDEMTTRALSELLGVSKQTLSELSKREIIVKGMKRGTWLLQPSVSGYVKHLREAAAARGGEAAQEARARLGAAQAALAEARAGKLSGELVRVDEVEAKWTAACRSIRGRVLAVADKMRDLPARQHVKLVSELRGALSDLSDG
jgi:phage terminase Nu1 subunit (DNA packaging protein)